MSEQLGFFSKMLPIYLLDYGFVVIIYINVAFWLAVLIDGHILPPYNAKKEMSKSTVRLYFEVILQLILQGFIATIIAYTIMFIPSPMKGIYGYNNSYAQWSLFRNAAVINIILFFLSKTLQGKLHILFSRFSRNANAVVLSQQAAENKI